MVWPAHIECCSAVGTATKGEHDSPSVATDFRGSIDDGTTIMVVSIGHVDESPFVWSSVILLPSRVCVPENVPSLVGAE